MSVSDQRTTVTRVPNARGEGARLRAEIVAAATGLLQAGDGPVTLRAVARAAGITAPSIYRHFADLDAVLRAVVEEAFDELEGVLRAAGSEGGPREHLVGLCRAYLDFAARQPERYRLMFGGAYDAADVPDGDPAVLADRAQIGLGAFRALQEALQGCIASGDSSSTDPFVDATALWVALHGLGGLRRTASLFPWPPGLEEQLVGTLARLRVR